MLNINSNRYGVFSLLLIFALGFFVIYHQTNISLRTVDDVLNYRTIPYSLSNDLSVGYEEYTQKKLYSKPSMKNSQVTWPKLQNETLCRERRDDIRNGFIDGWNAYVDHAWGADELKPIVLGPDDWLGGQGTMIIDSISTLAIMAIGEVQQDPPNKRDDVFSALQRARQWVARGVTVADNPLTSTSGSAETSIYNGNRVSLFESVIRILAGLVSAYDLTGDDVYLQRALMVGDMYITNFEINEKTSIPGNEIVLSRPTRERSYEKRMESIWEAEKKAREKTGKRPETTFFIPTTDTDLLMGEGKVLSGKALLAEMGLWLEFVALSDRSGDPHYAFHSLRALQAVLRLSRGTDGLVPTAVHQDGSSFASAIVTIGAGADSFFEYLIKTAQYAAPHRFLFDGDTPARRLADISEHWVDAMHAFVRALGSRTPEGLAYFRSKGESGGSSDTVWEHLACFSSGNLAFGSFYLNGYKIPSTTVTEATKVSETEDNKKEGEVHGKEESQGRSDDKRAEEEKRTEIEKKGEEEEEKRKGKENEKEEEKKKKEKEDQEKMKILEQLYTMGVGVGQTCYEMYHQTPTGLSPETVQLGTRTMKDAIAQGNTEYLMRPEVVESLFYLFRVTGDPKYQEWCWEIWTSIKQHSKFFDNNINRGYTALSDIHTATPKREDIFPSFFMAETIKYLFLTFSDPGVVIPLDQYVFSTEAHPFARREYLHRTLSLSVDQRYYKKMNKKK